MPRRTTPDPLAAAVGQRVRELREAAGLNMETLAFETDISKGHLSSLERGLVNPTVATLKTLADRLGVLVADFVIFPEDGERERVIDATRSLTKGALRKLARDLATKPPSRAR